MDIPWSSTQRRRDGAKEERMSRHGEIPGLHCDRGASRSSSMDWMRERTWTWGEHGNLGRPRLKMEESG